MTRLDLRRSARALAIATSALAFAAGCGTTDSDDGPEEGATETNVTRLACSDDSECLNGEPCVFASADAGVGQCGGDGEAATACTTADDCSLGEECLDGECALPGNAGGAAGTCLAGSPDCENLGPADQPLGGDTTSGPAGGTCLAGSPECENLGPADQPLGGGGGAAGTCLAGSPECENLGPADEPL